MKNIIPDGELVDPADVPVDFVTVIMSRDHSRQKKDLHCFNCGRIVCQYYTDVRVIIVGEIRQAKTPLDVMCSRCKTMIRIA